MSSHTVAVSHGEERTPGEDVMAGIPAHAAKADQIGSYHANQIWGLLPMDYYTTYYMNPENGPVGPLWVSPAAHLPKWLRFEVCSFPAQFEGQAAA